jgi:hypothetical protein
MQVLFPMMNRMPSASDRQSQFEDVEKSQLRGWLLLTKAFVSHADQILCNTDGIENVWFQLMSMHEKLFVQAKTVLLKNPLRDQIIVVLGAAKKTNLAENIEALQKTWSILERSLPDAKDIFEGCEATY